MKVPAKTLYTDAIDDFRLDPFYTGSEYVYTKQKVTPMTKSQLTDIWNKAQKEVSPLIQEAKKLRDAGVQIDEKGIATVYRGGNVSKEKLSDLRYNDYLSSVKKGKDITGNEGASAYGKNVVELRIPAKNLKIENGEIKFIGESKSLQGKKYPKEIYKAFNDVYGSTYTAKEIDAMTIKEVRDTASQGLTNGRAEFDKLTSDIWKKAQEKPLMVEAPLFVEPKKETFTPKIAKSIQAKAIEAGIPKETFNNLPEVEKIHLKEQVAKATEFINKDIEKARAVVRGEEPLPGNVNATQFIAGVEEYIKKYPDADMAYELANSNLTKAASLAGQEVVSAKLREPDSFTAKMIEIKKAREKTRIPDMDKKVSKAKKSLKEEINKDNLSKEDKLWDNFLESIKC